MRRSLLISLFTLLVLSVHAQDNKPWAGFGIEANYIAGRAFKHTKSIKADFPASSPAFDLNFVMQTHGTKDWQQRRRYPVIGLGVAYTIYDNNVVYGKCLSIYPNIRIPLITGKKMEWSLKAGYGLGYITKIYERYSSWDTLNSAMSSHLNNYTYLATELRYRINEHMDVQAGLNFSHVSNAALRSPNLGINKYGAHVGIRYSPVTSKPNRTIRDLPKLKNRIMLQLRFGISGSEMGTPDGPMNPIYSYSAFVSRRYAGKNKLYIGADYAYYRNIYMFLKNNEVDPGNEKSNSTKSAIFIGNEFLLGRIGIVFQAGYYIHKGMLTDYPVYEKLGGNVYLLQQEKGLVKELTLHCYLKAHLATAELAELGIGAAF
jgi:hypothetical protein